MSDEAIEAPEQEPDSSGFIFGLKVTAEAEVIKADGTVRE